MRKNLWAACAAVFVVAGCAQNSGVLKMGPDTYSVTAGASHGRGGMAEAKRMAYGDAAAECQRQGREFLVIGERATPESWTSGMNNVALDFRCLQTGDPELLRPRMVKTPDTVIEVRKP
jgi:hypothetical protein